MDWVHFSRLYQQTLRNNFHSCRYRTCTLSITSRESSKYDTKL